MKRTRTALAGKNAVFSLLNRAVSMLCGFACRSVFIRVLGNEYLGAGGMFGNIFSVLSLAELGFGEAVSQALYEPLAKGEHERLAAALRYYARVYRRVAWLTAALCAVLLPFLPYLFPDIVRIREYRAVFFLFAVHQWLSYYFAPKRALVTADQRMYAVMAVRSVTCVLASAAQIVFLYATHSYLIYIFLRIFFLSIDGFAICFYADRIYPFLARYEKAEPSPSYKQRIWKSTRALVLHRVGGVIQSSTDSILISAHMGLAHMGLYSNYALIIQSLGSFVALAVGAASAGIGNLGVTESHEKSVRVLKKLSFANFVLLTNVSVLLVNLIDGFIVLWLGRGHCFGAGETAVIIACFYMSYIRDPVQIYLHSYGVFCPTGILYLTRGLCNLVLSLLFIGRFGAVGAFAGTLASTVLVAFFWEVPILFRTAFGESGRDFMKEYYVYPLVTLGVCVLCRLLCVGLLRGAPSIPLMLHIGVRSILVCNTLLIVLYGRTERFRAFVSMFGGRLQACRGKRRNESAQKSDI